MVSREEILAQQFAYFTECNLATLEELKSLKSTPKCRIERQQDICNEMVTICKNFALPSYHSEYKGHQLPRLFALVSLNDSEKRK